MAREPPIDLKEYLICSIVGLIDTSVSWLSSYLKDDSAFREDLESIWQEMKPLYEKKSWICTYKESEDDFSSRMCTEVDLYFLVTVHHEMGHPIL